MNLIKIPASGLLINNIIVNAPPVDRYIIKNGFIEGEPLKESERRDLYPVHSAQLKDILSEFQKISAGPSEKAVLKFVNRFGPPLPGNRGRQPVGRITSEAQTVSELLQRYEGVTVETWNEEKRYAAMADLSYETVGKLKGVRLHIFGLRDDWSIADDHHAWGLTAEPALFCPDLLSYVYLQLYLIFTFRQPVRVCAGCGAIFSPQRNNAKFCGSRCYKAYWKRMKGRG